MIGCGDGERENQVIPYLKDGVESPSSWKIASNASPITECPIPNSVSQLKSLENADLTSNNWSGVIPPKSLEKIGMLSQLNLSFNNFSGEIPLADSSAVALEEFQKPLRPECWAPKDIASRARPDSSAIAMAELLGVSSFGAAYKAILRDGRMYAVKVLSLQNEEAHKGFSMEYKALGRVRHINLVKIIKSCSNLQFKVLVLEYMPSRSLGKHLYSDIVCELKLREPVKIAIDVGHAMEYLHHHSPVQVVRFKARQANVILEENMTAHVADCGILRITCANSMDLAWAWWTGISKSGCVKLWNCGTGNIDEEPSDRQNVFRRIKTAKVGGHGFS
eukprot:Gb_40071 [translate_table: standard]